MAFVTPSTVTSFIGAKANASICKTSASTTKTTTAKNDQQRMLPTMAFSSIDDPSSAVVAEDLSIETADLVIEALFKQIFGNAYLMECEKDELAVPISDFRMGTISVRGLARAMAKSHCYKKRYFDRCGPYRFIELSYKHFLGRAPSSQEEISEHVIRLNEEGYDKEIDSYFDSEEYISYFGNETVPRFIFKGQYARNDDFNRMCIVRQHWDGCSTSTISGSTALAAPIKAQLTMPRGSHVGNPMNIKKGIKADHNNDPLPRLESGYESPLNANAPLRIRVQIAENCYKVFETDGYQAKDATPAWIKEKVAADSTKKWNGVWF